MRLRSPRCKNLTLLLVMAAAIGPAACGDSDGERAGEAPRTSADGVSTDSAPRSGGDGSGRDEGRADGSRREPASPAGGTDEQRARRVVERMYRALAAGDAAGVCASLTTAAREEVAQNVPGGSTEAPGERTCERSFGKFLDAAASSGTLDAALKARVNAVKVDGTTARATVALDGQSGEVQLVEEAGEWRLGAPPGVR
jgi:hypothetical protein